MQPEVDDRQAENLIRARLAYDDLVAMRASNPDADHPWRDAAIRSLKEILDGKIIRTD